QDVDQAEGGRARGRPGRAASQATGSGSSTPATVIQAGCGSIAALSSTPATISAPTASAAPRRWRRLILDASQPPTKAASVQPISTQSFLPVLADATRRARSSSLSRLIPGGSG